MHFNNPITAKFLLKRLRSVLRYLILFAFATCISFTVLTSTSSADPKAETSSNIIPQRGEVMQSVHARLGKPKEIVPPVGEPPIERWIYKDFTVYFENDRVIHSVIKKGEIPPRPQNSP